MTVWRVEKGPAHSILATIMIWNMQLLEEFLHLYACNFT